MTSSLSLLGEGSCLGRYEIVRPVAHGGMGAVWLARLRGRHGFEQLVAIKTILPEYAREERFRALFLEEARLVSRIRHPNVAQVIDLGEQEETLYCVMEWVDGRSLDALVGALAARRASLPLAIALRIVSDACLGAHAAHELRDERGALLGVVHRDVSPQNVLVAESGATKLVDFGIARARTGLEEEARERIVRGKLAYMAPEQAEGKVVDRRADVWSLGAVLFALVTGAPIVTSRDQMAQVLVSRRLPSAAQLAADEAAAHRPGLRDAFEHALVVDPELRQASALELHRTIERALLAAGAPTTTADVARFLAVTLPQTMTYSERIEAPRTARSAHETKAERPDVEVCDARVDGVDEAVAALTAGVRDAARVLVARRADERRAVAAFNAGLVDAVLIEPVTERRLSLARSAAIARARRRRAPPDAPTERGGPPEPEETLRGRIVALQTTLERTRRARSQLANAARLSVIGEMELRHARETGEPVTVIVYRPASSAFTVPPRESAKLVGCLDARAVVSEEAAEWVAVAPGRSASALRAQLAELDPRLGAWALREARPDEPFATVLALARAGAVA